MTALFMCETLFQTKEELASKISQIATAHGLDTDTNTTNLNLNLNLKFDVR